MDFDEIKDGITDFIERDDVKDVVSDVKETLETNDGKISFDDVKDIASKHLN